MRWRRRRVRSGNGDGEVDALRERARAAAADGDLETAIDLLAQAALLRPGDAEIHKDLGMFFQRAGLIEAARHAWGLAVELDGGDTAVRSALRALPPPPPHRVNFDIGQRLEGSRAAHNGDINRYTVLDVRKGGFGVVYILRDASGRTFAAKSFNARLLWSDSDRARFLREASTWISLDEHPHIVTAQWAETIEGFPCLIMEYVEGGDLGDRLRRGPLNLREAIRFGLHVCDGMGHAWRQLGLIHRDLKPSNCMVTPDDTLKVTDFGLAHTLRKASEATLGMSEAPASARAVYTTVAGTPAFMPPEQFKPGAELGTWTDVYAFGVMLFQMLTCELPPPGGRAKRHIARSPAFWNIADPLAKLILRCVEPDADARPADFAEVREHLEHAHRRLTGTTAPAAPPAKAATIDTWVDRSIAFRELNQLEEALEAAESAIALTPSGDDVADSKAWQVHGLVLARFERFADAVASYDRALELNQQEPSLWASKGGALSRLHRFDESLDCLDRCLELAPDLGLAWRLKAISLNNLGRYDEANTAFQKAAELVPRRAELFSSWSVSLTAQGRFAEALQRADQSLEIAPRLRHGWYARGLALREQGELESALGCFDRVLEIEPDTGAWRYKALTLEKMGLLEEADQAYQEAMKLGENDSDLLNDWAVLLREQGKYQQSLERTDQALAISPEDPLLWANRARVLRLLNHRDEAAADCQHALSLNPDHPYAREIRDWLASYEEP